MFITKKKHDAIVADVRNLITFYHREMSKYRDLYLSTKAERDAETKRANKLSAELAAAHLEAAANADDAAKHRRSKAGLKQFRKVG